MGSHAKAKSLARRTRDAGGPVARSGLLEGFLTGDLVEVVWDDAAFDFQTESVDDSPYEVRTFGYIAHVGQHLHIAGEILPDGFRAVTKIPVALIRSMTRLEEA